MTEKKKIQEMMPVKLLPYDSQRLEAVLKRDISFACKIRSDQLISIPPFTNSYKPSKLLPERLLNFPNNPSNSWSSTSVPDNSVVHQILMIIIIYLHC